MPPRTEGAPTANKYYVHLARAYYAAKKSPEARESMRRAKTAGFKPDDLHPLERAAYQQLLKAL